MSPFLSAAWLALAVAANGDTVLVEAESFEEHGGWKLDTQFIDTMGSPYLLAHGLGRTGGGRDAPRSTFPPPGPR